jgi:hypothetical protein
VFNQTVLQLLPALLAVRCVLLEHLQVHQVVAVEVAQSFEVDELLAEEEFQKFPEEIENIQHLKPTKSHHPTHL